MRRARVRPRTASTARFTSSKTSARVRAWSSFALKSIGRRHSFVRLKTLLDGLGRWSDGNSSLGSIVEAGARVNTTGGKTNERFIRADTDGGTKPTDVRTSYMVAPSPYYAASPVRRSAPSLPFGWGAVTVLLVGAGLLILGIL